MKHHSKKQGFTLIELLVVMAIIAILAAILVPLAPKLIGTAKRNKAKGEVNTIAMAVKQYYNDYGRMPDAAGPGAAPSTTVVQILIANNTAKNPRNTVYLETETSDTTGIFLDPWGNQYEIFLDHNYDGKTDYDGQSYRTSAVAVSNGPDGSAGTPDDIASIK